MPDNPTPLDASQAETEVAEANQDIFDERFRLYMGELERTCQARQAKAGFGIVNDPDLPHPVIFGFGNNYEIAKLLAMALRGLKQELAAELEA